MARRGVFELRHVLLRYELAGGSSAGVRSFVETDLVDWARAHPFVRVETQVHRGHPNVIGQYGTYRLLCLLCMFWASFGLMYSVCWVQWH